MRSGTRVQCRGQSKQIRIGTAGWSVPREYAARVCGEGSGDESHLERYARAFCCAEVNSRFYRPHQESTWRRWAESVPEGFQFAVKMPKAITHEAELGCGREELAEFFAEIGVLGEKLGPVLVQLAPSLVYEPRRDRAFLRLLREEHAGAVVLEARHASWFTEEVETVLREFRVARVAADPPRPEGRAERPGGWEGMVYYRLHGSPRMYYSAYDEAYLAQLASVLRARAAEGAEVWCVFDNTASGAAMGDALRLMELLGEG